MDTNRIKINNYDLSYTTEETETSYCGLTVIKAEKGSSVPIRIPAGSTAKLQDLFGQVSADYPELYEASVFNSEYDLYVSAPYTSAQMPVAYITGDGIFRGANLVTYNSNVDKLIDESDLDVSVDGITEFGEGNVDVLCNMKYPRSNGFVNTNKEPISVDNENDAGVIPQYNTEGKYINFNTGLTYQNLFNVKSETKNGDKVYPFRISNFPAKINGSTTLEFYITEDKDTKSNYAYIIKQVTEDNEKQVGEGVTNDNGTLQMIIRGVDYYNDVDDENLDSFITSEFISIHLNEITERKSLVISWYKNYDSDKIYGTIYPKYPSTRALTLSFNTFNEKTGYSVKSVSSRNILKISAYETNGFHSSSDYAISVTGSLDETSKLEDNFIGFNTNNTSYKNQYLFGVYTIKKFTTLDELTNITLSGYKPIVLDGGIREFGDDDSKLHNLGWTYVKENDYSDVDIFFDCERHNSSTTKPVATDNYFYSLASTYPLSRFRFNYTVNPDNIENLQPLAYGSNYWNICNEGIITLSTTGARFMTTFVGAMSLMDLRICENSYGGIAPAYLNSGTPAQGGQLNFITVSKLRYKYNKDQQLDLDDVNMNPIINDNTYGIMIVGQRTCKEGSATDWSYIGHVSSFLQIQREIKNTVMIPQLMKANNPYYRQLRKEQCEMLLNKRTSGSNRIWAETVCDTSTADGVNDAVNRAARKFVINIKVKVETYSEYVVLNFTNVGQDTTLVSSNES